MESSIKRRNVQRGRRVLRVRKQVKGSSNKPRLCVFKSNRHISVQIIDDERSVTLASYGTMLDEMQKANLGKKSKEAARRIGTKIAEIAKQKQIDHVIFDRGRYKYHGILAELANAARESGLQF